MPLSTGKIPFFASASNPFRDCKTALDSRRRQEKEIRVFPHHANLPRPGALLVRRRENGCLV